MKTFLISALLALTAGSLAHAQAFSAPGLTRADRSLQPGAAAACKTLETKTAQVGSVPLKRLGDLPPGLLEHAVLREVAGCPVREVVYAGQIYYVPSVVESKTLSPAIIPGR